MGLLGNILGNAVSEGIGKGIQNAVGKAVEGAVRPAADKWAGQAAQSLNQATQDLADSTQATHEAAQSAVQAAQGAPTQQTAAPAQGGGMADLGAALSSWATAMQGAAAQAAQNMKECPQCGEVVTADHKFCPKCGAQLPERTLGAGALCPKCGRQNVPGTTYCAECGTLLPAAEEARAAQSARWDELLPQYPKWTLGGEVSVEARDAINGHPAVSVSVHGGSDAQLGAWLGQYVALLRADGFVPFYGEDSDIYYKVVDGVCRTFDKTDANQGDFLTMTFFVGDYDRRAAQRAQAPAQNDAVKAAADTAKAAADAAKGLFKKFF